MSFLYRGIRKLRRVFAPTLPPHPIDLKYNIETTSIMTPRESSSGSELDQYNIGYVGAQPSIVRKCLDLLPINEKTVFIDLGCGKGRVLAAACEYPFAQVLGIEFSPKIFEIAERNAVEIEKQSETPITVIEGDATQFPDPEEKQIVLFLYNSFDLPLVQKLLAYIKTGVGRKSKIFLIYYNPVHFEAFDNSGIFARLFAAKLPFAVDELASAPFDNRHDSVVVYQNAREPMLKPLSGANSQVRTTIPRLGAEVMPQSDGLRL